MSIQGTSNSFKFYQRDVANDLSHSFDVKFVPIDILASTTFWEPSHERVSNDFFHLDTHFDDEIPVFAVAARFNLAPLSAFTTILPDTQYYNVLNQWVQMPVESWATTVPADSTVQIKMVHSALPGWVKNAAHVLIRVGLNYERPQYVADKPKETYQLGYNEDTIGKILFCTLTTDITPDVIRLSAITDQSSVVALVLPTPNYASCTYTYSYVTPAWITANNALN